MYCGHKTTSTCSVHRVDVLWPQDHVEVFSTPCGCTVATRPRRRVQYTVWMYCMFNTPWVYCGHKTTSTCSVHRVDVLWSLDHVETYVGSGGGPVQQALGTRPDAYLVPLPQQEDAGHVRGHWTAHPVPRPPAR